MANLPRIAPDGSVSFVDESGLTAASYVPISYSNQGNVIQVTPTSPLPASDFFLDIARGKVTNMYGVNKFGRNSAIAAGTTEDIWGGSSLYSFPTTALMTSISQTTDQTAMRGAMIRVFGLDANWNRVEQTVLLDASDTTTVVALDTPLLRCYRMRVEAAVLGDSSIRVHNAGETQDYAVIDAGENQTEMAIYTVAAGETAYVTNYYATINPVTNQDPTTMQIRLWARDNSSGYERQLKHTMGLDVDASSGFQHFFQPYTKFTEKTDIYIAATTVGKIADVSAGFDMIVEVG